MVKVRLPWQPHKDLICIHIENLRFVVLSYDSMIKDWRTVCLFNFDHVEELKVSGKRFANSGLLRAINTQTSGGLVFLADDTIICSIKF